MKCLRALLAMMILCAFSNGAQAEDSGTMDHEAMGHAMAGHGHDAAEHCMRKSATMPGHCMPDPEDRAVAQQQTVILTLSPAAPLVAGKSAHIVARLETLADKKPLTLDGLKEIHTKKLHLLIVDPSLSDYHHIHPVAGKNPGEYVFDFTPMKNGRYRVWADIVPVATGKQEYVRADMGSPAAEKPVIDKTPRLTASVKGYDFALTLDGTPKAGAPLMAELTVTKDGKPFAELEPVMGAFAHVVGFTEDYNSVLHIHPMGKEPSRDNARGGPTLSFHLEPKAPGFVKLFAQVRIDGQDVFVPFGLTVVP